MQQNVGHRGNLEQELSGTINVNVTPGCLPMDHVWPGHRGEILLWKLICHCYSITHLSNMVSLLHKTVQFLNNINNTIALPPRDIRHLSSFAMSSSWQKEQCSL